jgi:hypothetical protein
MTNFPNLPGTSLFRSNVAKAKTVRCPRGVLCRHPKKNPNAYGTRLLFLLAHGAGAALAGLGLQGLSLRDTLGQDGGVLGSLILDLLGLAALQGDSVALVLQALGSDQTLDLGGLGVRLLALTLGLDLTSNDVLADIVILAEGEESANLGGALGTKALGVDDVGNTGDVVVSLLDDGESEDGQVHADDAATDGLSLALTGAAGTVAGVAVGQQKSDTGRVHDTLLHGETLLVVSTGDAEDVALELIAEVVAGDFSAHALLHEVTELSLILNLDELLAAIGRVGDVQLHVGGRCGRVDSKEAGLVGGVSTIEERFRRSKRKRS